jgi:hypothetical protein
MMSGSFREYNWKDILRLVMKDAGLDSEADQRSRGQAWVTGAGLTPPKCDTDTCIRINVYDKSFEQRSREHLGQE